MTEIANITMEENPVSHLLDKPLPIPEKKEVVPASPKAITVSNEDAEMSEDMKLGRETLRSMIEKGEAAVTEIANVAEQTGHPRVFEVMGTLIKNVAETVDSLVGLHKTKVELSQITSPPETGVNVENAVFIGSTKDLQKLLKKKTPVIEGELVDEQENSESK